MKVTITFESLFMGKDKLEFEVKTAEDAREMYFDWWKKYGKDEEYAINKLVHTEISSDENRTIERKVLDWIFTEWHNNSDKYFKIPLKLHEDDQISQEYEDFKLSEISAFIYNLRENFK